MTARARSFKRETKIDEHQNKTNKDEKLQKDVETFATTEEYKEKILSPLSDFEPSNLPIWQPYPQSTLLQR